ncbi:MAG: N-acetylmuramoyl-L-alanine amidase CwlD [Firmicutes bacterium]|nr:N-acetylmuramoyl-L-alanine amidase CwlD [Bacillota bacterium]
MKNYCLKVFILFLIILVILVSTNVSANLPLSGKLIVVDAGHGAKDPGTMYRNIYEKDINLKISLALEKELSRLGASVILTRDGDYDLSTPNTNHRKKSDFDNRIKLINESKADMYLSIHLNYLSDSSYYGAQVFYNQENELIASKIQEYLNENLNSDREIKKIPSNTYMYNKLKIKGVLIECGFLSNNKERNLLINKEYQQVLAKTIAQGVSYYYQ